MEWLDFSKEALNETDPRRAGVAALMAGAYDAAQGMAESRCPFGGDWPALRDRWLEGHRMFCNEAAAQASASTLPMARRGHAYYSSEDFREVRP